ncbi:pre-peptidase C-terminal domain-containing protein [Nostocaceae cyanobacterium CENA357]|uniref:Pre-peptidase C-terminal domain-containing protein n=1 Tax=Atlanticothrix silvestris CENA357 TaxID=1725252 RepID=A0A8J7L1S2_9CYAN|nr:pre-peptidase C-terminal domain-containing protein [Atlanticothrix silvestris]MBH8552476.1 pre-peptidase C-terminal domain-containing protein [Atlanticothrix silvestris CENA357]
MATYSGFSDPGNNTATALNTATYIGGSLTSTSNIFQDSLSSLDRDDYYKFTLSSSSIVTLSLDGLAANSDANLILTDSNNNTITAPNLPGNASENIRFTLNNQPPNTYYARIYLVTAGVSTAYNLTLSAETILDSGIADNTITEANANRDISAAVNTGSYSATDFVASRGFVKDASDYYKFTLNNNGTIGINLNPSSGNADIQLLNSSGQSLQPAATSTQTGTNPDSINRSLAAGTYYLQVYGSADSTNYNLQVNFTADAPDQGGNTLATATSISLPATISDLVNTTDPQDYYKFTLASTALVDIRFTSLSADANLTLQNQNGSAIVPTTTQSGTTLDVIHRSLNPGTYNILVTRAAGTTAANYTLSVVAQTINPDQALNNTTNAQNLGTLNGSISRSEFVGSIDTNDYYKFNLNTASSFNLTLSGLSDNADIQLIRSNGQTIPYTNQTGTTNETINNLSLSAGTYYICVYPSGSAETFYNLDITVEPQAQQLEINPGSSSSDPDNLTNWNNTLYFTANDGSTGIQLWRSNGTTNTRITNASGFNPDDLIVFNNKLYFTATNSTFGKELWQYDGNSVNRISDINLNAGSSNPSNLTVVGNKLFFTAVDSSNTRKLWVYNSTNVSLVDINPGFSSSQSPTFTTFNSKLFFTAKNNSELWSTDGTVGGTQVISVGGTTKSYPAHLRVVGSTLYFTANDGTSGFEVWKYQSGTTASLVKDITPGNNGYAPTYLTGVGNTLYFVTDSNNDFNLELWKSDGTANGTVRIKNDGQAPNVGLGPFSLTAIADSLYFIGNDQTTGLELWKTDGTDANTVLVKDIWTGTNVNTQPNNSIPTSLVNFNGTLAFAASDGTNREVWLSDGTTANTRKVSNINATGLANPGRLTVVGTQLFFIANNGTNGTELYVL